MKCRQVDELLFSYYDRQEMPLRLRQELEEHLRQCPDCRLKADFTARESEALLYDGDIPEMSADFSRRVMAAVKQDHTAVAAAAGWSFRSQMGPRGWWATGMIAAVVVLCLMLPGNLQNPVQPLPTDHKAAGPEQQEARTVARIMLDEDTMPILQKAPVDFGQISREPDRIEVGRGDLPPPGSPGGYNNKEDEVAIFRPSYLPPDYHLVRVESDLNDSILLHYENNQGSYISLKTLPELEKQQNAVMEKESSLFLAADDQSRKASDRNDPTVIRWTCEREQTVYRLELTGSLPPEELGRIAASVQ